MKTIAQRGLAFGAVAALALSLAACGDAKESSKSKETPSAAPPAGSPGPAGSAPGAPAGGLTTDKALKVGLLLPETKTARYEKFDKPIFEAKIKELCSKCTVQYSNAQQQADNQQRQAEAMLTNGIDVMVLDAVDAKAAGAIVNAAKAKNVPVIAYDRLATGPISGYVSFDNETVGKLQGTALLDAIKAGGDPKRGQVILVNGSPTDPNAAEFKKGVHSVLDGQVNIGREYDTADWSNDKAQSQTEQAITALGGPSKIVGVYAANDGMSGGAIAALKGAGANPIPPVGGQDAELAGLQRILAGTQTFTIAKPYRPQAETAAEMAIAVVLGQKYDKATSTKNNGTVDAPSVILPPVAVGKDKIKSVVIDGGYFTVADVCTADFAAACKAAGIQ